MRKNELKEIIRESIREAIKEERLNLFEILLPEVSKKEMREIEKKYGKKPAFGKKDYQDLTKWVLE